MKKLAFLAALISCGSTVCHAQSKVTLYGILDEGMIYLSNAGGSTGGKKVYMDSVNGINGSRFGLSGSEDLGGGSQAVFVIEPGLNINTGQSAQGGTFLGRQAFVGLHNDSAGTVAFGRQYDMIVYYAQPVTVQGQVSGQVFLHPGDVDNTGNSVRANNAIRYMSPSFRGLTFGAEYSVGGVAGNVTSGSGYSLGLAYANGPFTFGSSFEYFKDPTSATAGAGFFTNNANGTSVMAQSINKGYSSARAYQTATVGVGYAVGNVTLTTSWSNTQYANLGGNFSGAMARFNAVDFAAKWLARPDLSFAAGYVYQKGSPVNGAGGREVGNQHYNQIMLLGDYLLSKRTDVYVEGAWQRASGTSSLGAAAVADIGNVGDSTNNHQLLVRAALRHKF